MRYFEDFRAGQVIPLGPFGMVEADMLAFARQFDPQRFHVDPVAARDSIYGGLIASGLQTLSVFCRTMIDALPDMVGQGSPGWDEVRWRKPVLAGDVLSGELEVLEVHPSRSRPQIGRVNFKGTLRNQQGETVLDLLPMVLIQRRTEDDERNAD